jgi:LysR family transcriptional regulator for metE and metH
MDLRHLKMIQEVARQGNLTKAAERIYLSQSALSHQLKDVEAFFNTQIFIRQKKQMLLTNTGKIILEASESIIGEIERAKNKIKFLSEKNAGEIKISTECYTSYHWLSSFLKEYKTLYPKVEINIDTISTYNSVNALLENKIDIAIVEDNTNSKLNYIPLFRDEFVAIVPGDHPWSQLKWVNPEMFYTENYLMYTIPNEISTIYKLLFKTGKPQKVIKIALTEVIIQMVKAGMGVTVLPHWVVTSWLESNELKAVPITKKGIKRTWYAATLKNKELPPYMYVFMRNLSKHLKHSDELAMLEFN